MLKTRVIPTLLLRNAGLVKGEKFLNHKYVGDPINAVKIFNTKEVDELVFLDIAASTEQRQPNYALLTDIASEAFMPFAYGGGLSSMQNIEALFKIGVEKAIINTAATRDLTMVRQASAMAGSQSIVVAIDVKRSMMGKYTVYSQSGQLNTGLNPVDYAKMAADAGAGELIVTSIRSWLRHRFDLENIPGGQCSGCCRRGSRVVATFPAGSRCGGIGGSSGKHVYFSRQT